MLAQTDKKANPFEAAVKEAGGLGPGSELTLSGLYGSARAYFLASAFKRLGRIVLAVLPTEEAAAEFAEDLRFFLPAGTVCLYPSTEVLPFEPQPVHHEITAARMETLHRLLTAGPFITVASAPNLMQRVVPAGELSKKVLRLCKGGEYPRDELLLALHEAGYARMSMVEERGEMSVRGGILDIFPPMRETPLRIEFFGDEVESIRGFDVSTQRSAAEEEEVLILPAGEATLSRDARLLARDRLMERADALGLERDAWEPIYDRLRDGAGVSGMSPLLPLFYERLDTVFDYLAEDAMITVIDPELAASQVERFAEEVETSAGRFREKGHFFVDPQGMYLGPAELEDCLKGAPVVNLEAFRDVGTGIRTESNLEIRREISARKGTEIFKPLADRIKGWLDEGRRVYVTAHNRAQAERTQELLEGYALTPSIISGVEIIGRGSAGLAVATGSLHTGFRFPCEALVIVSEEEVFGERVRRRAPPAKKLDAFLTQLQDLSVGDCIVHSLHGIGLYRGLKRISIDSVENEFLLLEYRGGDKLYLPVWRMDRVSRYHGFEGKTPDLDRLGGTGWERTKKKVRLSVERLAGELLKLYAERQVAEGFAFTPPDRLFHEFEAGFEYEETPDQARAIEETLKDMQEPRPMDRLICGDVGYGKTEVAIRAAFKAVLDGKQVGVLVPTTVLAEQHYATFRKRLAAYPVVVEALSRFRSKKEQKDIVGRLGSGKVDIVIGTHRLLGKDIEFKDLGLIVIDEEHRFGVAHKEKLKRIRKSVDVLTLTATPIPRTLHMSLASIRELSIINTPPEDRLAIKTSVIRFDESVIAEAIERELNRGGQVFFVHNRIHSMPAVEDFLRRAVPRARIAHAHGQMKEAELEAKMLAFVNHDIDVLLSTAIIESGLDIPTANTIIINRADHFGLAELYQLRGRVGRSRHRAYAYFVCPSMAELTGDARKRIEVIRELAEPGSGFKIASYDLEIRGAGELLGTAQSGQIAAVGFEMYTSLLEEAVREMKGEKVVEEVEPEITLAISSFIPEEYIPDVRQRLGFYKRLASVDAQDDIYAIEEEMADRYGPVPAFVENLMQTMELKLLLKRLRARELSQKGKRLHLTFQSQEQADSGHGIVERALDMVRREPKRYRLAPEGRFIVFLYDTPPIEAARYVLKEFLKG
ncbi:MAG: transcription-repair coupling factor [Thermodesulfobacteriota bacterium]